MLGPRKAERHRQARVQHGVRRRGQIEAQDRAAGGGTHRRGRHRPRVHGRHRRRSQRRCRWAPAVAAAGRRRRQRGGTSKGRLAGGMTAAKEENGQKRPRRQGKERRTATAKEEGEARRRRRQREERRTTRSEGGCFWGWCGHGRASQNHGRRGDNWPWWVARAASLPPQLPRALRQPWRQRANTPQHPHPQRARVRARATAAGGPRPCRGPKVCAFPNRAREKCAYISQKYRSTCTIY